MEVAGLLLAAGAGRRLGEPKALTRVGGEPMVSRALQSLRCAGCAPVHVVLGARAADVLRVLPAAVQPVFAPDWESGMSASLRAGLAALTTIDPLPSAVLVHLVDLPDVPVRAVARLRELASTEAVARASYQGRPGHPVLLGNRWWGDVAESATGDSGAREWLRSRDDLVTVECGDLATGGDVDTPADLARGTRYDPYARGCECG